MHCWGSGDAAVACNRGDDDPQIRRGRPPQAQPAPHPTHALDCRSAALLALSNQTPGGAKPTFRSTGSKPTKMSLPEPPSSGFYRGRNSVGADQKSHGVKSSSLARRILGAEVWAPRRHGCCGRLASHCEAHCPVIEGKYRGLDWRARGSEGRRRRHGLDSRSRRRRVGVVRDHWRVHAASKRGLAGRPVVAV